MNNNEAIAEQAERVAQRRAPAAGKSKSFDDLRPEQMMLDADSSALIEAKQRPDCAKFGATSAFCGAYFVPVSFVARDWKVTPAPHPCAADCRTLGRPFNGQRLLGGALTPTCSPLAHVAPV